MTILNIAVGEHEIAIVTDSRQSAPTSSGQIVMHQQALKCHAFPAQKLLVAHSGSAGCGRVAAELLAYLNRGIVSGDILALAESLPPVLRALAVQEKCSGDGRIVLAGIAGDAAHAYIFQTPDWHAQRVPQGAWIQPDYKLAQVEALSTPEGPPAPFDADLVAPTGPAPAFRDMLRTITTAPDRQHTENPISCGGTLILSTIDTGGVIRQTALRVLE